MGQFSDDGRWWWDGAQWIATSQVVLPDLPMTEFERSGKLNEARGGMRTRDQLLVASMLPSELDGGVSWIAYLAHQRVLSDYRYWIPGISFLFVQHRVLREYRLWTLEQLALATSYLLGPNEEMVAGETTMLGSGFFKYGVTRDLAVAVTAAHVLVFRIDSINGQPRWVALAARSSDVRIQLRSGAFGSLPTLMISGWNGTWAIRGAQRLFEPGPVVDAWHQAATGAFRTG